MQPDRTTMFADRTESEANGAGVGAEGGSTERRQVRLGIRGSVGTCGSALQ